MNAEIIGHLLDEMEEYYRAFDHYPLYLLGWELNDGVRTAEQKAALARKAYDAFSSRHQVKVVWVPWPVSLDKARPLEPGTPLDFDLDPDASPDTELQVLVPE